MSAPYIPATALGGDLVRDWTGPAEQRNEMDDDERTEFWSEIVLMPRIQRSRPSVVVDGLRYATNGWSGDIAPDFVHLDPRRPEVAHRVADVLRRKGHEVGHLSPAALGGRVTDAATEERMQQDEGGGTLRGRTPAADVSAVLLAASVAGVEAGRGVVRGVLGGWERHRDGFCFDRHLLFPTVKRQSVHYARHYDAESRFGGWSVHMPSFGDPVDQGEETGPEGRAAADAALLRLGYAYLDPAAPFGVVVPFLNLENER